MFATPAERWRLSENHDLYTVRESSSRRETTFISLSLFFAGSRYSPSVISRPKLSQQQRLAIRRARQIQTAAVKLYCSSNLETERANLFGATKVSLMTTTTLPLLFNGNWSVSARQKSESIVLAPHYWKKKRKKTTTTRTDSYRWVNTAWFIVAPLLLFRHSGQEQPPGKQLGIT